MTATHSSRPRRRSFWRSTASSGRRHPGFDAGLVVGAVIFVLAVWGLLRPAPGGSVLLFVVALAAVVAVRVVARAAAPATQPSTRVLLEHINDLRSVHMAAPGDLNAEDAETAGTPRPRGTPPFHRDVAQLRVHVLEQALEEQSQRVRELLEERGQGGRDAAERARPSLAVRALRERLADVPGALAVDRVASALERLVVTTALERVSLPVPAEAAVAPSGTPSSEPSPMPTQAPSSEAPPAPNEGSPGPTDAFHEDAPAFMEPEVVLPVPRPAPSHSSQRRRRGLRRHVRI